MKNILLILSSVLLHVGAQICIRKGMLRIGKVSLDFSLIRMLPEMITNIYLWLAFFCYGISLIVWIVVLSRVELSFAYSFSSLGFVIVAIAGYFLFHERITGIRIIGIVMVCIGVFLIYKSQ